MARVSIFGNADGPRVQGNLSRDAGEMFEDARLRLAVIVGRDPKGVSDGAVIEFLARGERNAKAFLKLKGVQ